MPRFSKAALIILVILAGLSVRVGAATFSHDVAPIVFLRCAECHHPGESAPFSLLSYDDVKRHARQIVDVTQRRFMPPWLPSEGTEMFAGARRLSDEQLRTLKDWVDGGLERGNDVEMPAAPVFADDWQTGTPDLVLESPPYSLSSQTKDVFRNFVIPVKLDGPRWVESIELRPTNPRITHHARLGVDSTNESMRRNAEDNQPGYEGMAWAQDPVGQMVIWAPGMIASAGMEGVAWRLFPNTSLVLHTHMQPSGKPEVMQFRIGVHFAKQPPSVHPVMMRIGSCDIDILAGAKHHVVTDSYTLPIDLEVQTIFPHAHSLCQSVEVVAEAPDGSKQTMISIPRFDENWHDLYRYAKPLRLAKGTRLVSTFAYDNTDENVRNRNHPARRVVYGSNITDEMAEVYLQTTAVHPDQRAVLMESYQHYDLQSQLTGYRKAMELYPDNPWNQEGLATCYVGLGKPAEAIAVLEQRLKNGSPAVYPVVSLGMALLANGDNTRAEAEERRAVAIDGQYPLAWFGLGRALAAQVKRPEAEEAYRKAIALAPGLLDARLNLVDLLIQSDKIDEATALCSAALSDSPDMANIYLKLGEMSAQRQQYDLSLKYFETAREVAPYTHPAKVLLAVWCIGHAQQDKGVNLLLEARSDAPNYPVTSLMLGQLASRGQQWQVARQYLDGAAKMPIPDNWPESHRTRFLVLLHSERFRVAQQLQDADLARDALKNWSANEPVNEQVRKALEELERGTSQ